MSCDPGSLPGSDCGMCGTVTDHDEIGHAALIPAGDLAGKVLFWTGCDFPAEHDSTREYSTHIWDPAAPAVPPTVHPAIAGIISNHPTVKTDDGPFCSGHVWILDGSKQLKLLAIGGNDRRVQTGETPCVMYNYTTFLGLWPVSCGATKAYWFDPLASPPQWSSTLPDLPGGLWYPTVITYLDNVARRFPPIVLGGSGVWFPGCGMNPQGLYHQYQERWTLPTFTQPNWTTAPNAGYSWYQYPRASLLHDGKILVAGSTVCCESPPPSDTPANTQEFIAFDNAHEYGNAAGQGGPNPVRLISASGTTLTEGIDPNDAMTDVGGWHYCNSVILQTLKNKYDDPGHPGVPTGTGYPGVPGAFESLYDLDRVIVMGGVREDRNTQGKNPPALSVVREYYIDGTWKAKTDAPTGRLYGNTIVLPNGTILCVGGESQINLNTRVYYSNAEAFDPQLPLSSGFWKGVATRPLALGASVVTPRAYHSVAMLLKSGNVVLMGGTRALTVNYGPPDFIPVNTLDTIEVYHPSYTYCTQRPQIISTVPELHYGSAISIRVNKESRVDYAVLMGVSSVTHHFDYGQRYVELMVRNDVSKGTDTDGWIEILPPTESTAAMAPEGYYMLFLVDVRDNPLTQEKIPSVQGEFVKLTFNP